MREIVCLLLLLSIAACTPTVTPPPSATAALPLVTFTPRPTNTPPPTATDIPALPPTWTPGVTATSVRATDEPIATFTPTIDPNSTLLAQPTRVECAGFGIDLGRTPVRFTIGTDPEVFWRPAQNAFTYRITLLDDQVRPLFGVTMSGTSFAFDGDLFEAGRNYSWEVRPLDVSGNQMCVSRGSALTPVLG